MTAVFRFVFNIFYIKDVIKFIFIIAVYCCVSVHNLNASLRLSDIEIELSKGDFKDQDEEKILFIYTGIDYIPQEIVELFTKLTGITVVKDIFDSNEVLEAKLLAGGAQYDIVSPTAFPCFSRQIITGVYQKIDKTKIDMSLADDDLMKRLAICDENNDYAIPYQWGISGIGIDEEAVRKLCPEAPTDSLAIVFEEKYLRKLSKGRVSLYESSDELLPAFLAYSGRDPEKCTKDDLRLVAEHFGKIRKYITKFTNYGFEDLASGNACVILGTSGDIRHVRNQQILSRGGSSIRFIFPKEGASLWIDVLAIPKAARHVKNAHLFLKFVLHPRVSAEITNLTSRANGISASKKYVDKELLNDQFIFPTKDIMDKCYIEKYQEGNINHLKTNVFTKIKADL